jgi:hypothetical protein
MKNVYVVGGRTYEDYVNWILPLGFKITFDINDSDVVFFAGGEDVSPFLYGEETGSYISKSEYRDQKEISVYLKALELKLPCIGICRGGQFLTVMNGYKIVQHMSHPSNHDVTTFDGKQFKVTSSHHNQFLLQPNKNMEQSDYQLIAWTNKLSPIHLNGRDEDYNFPSDYKEPEIVLYDGRDLGKSKCLAVQGHCEWCPLESEFVKYCQELVIQCILS